jgi:homocysteine S-methyltransferase
MIVIDGAFGTELETKGVNIKDILWSGKALLTDPKIVYEVHMDYYKAGADIGITNTYNCFIEAFAQHGMNKE